MRCASLALLGLLMLAVPVAAHNLGAECKLVGDRVQVEAYFDDDTPARDAKITVRTTDGQSLAEGRTDDKGCWSFARPAAGRYEIVVDAGAGHRAVVKVTVPGEAEGLALAPTRVSEGQAREEFTRTPWLKVGIGLITIALFAGALWLARQAGKSKAVD